MIHRLAVVWLIFVIAFIGGVVVYAGQIWPYPIIRDIEAFLTGGTGEKQGLSEKIANDLDFSPLRHVVETQAQTSSPDSLTPELNLPLRARRTPPMMYLGGRASRGYRLIYGAFDFERERHGVVLLDPNGQVQNVWQTSQDDVTWPHREDKNVFPHGIAITNKGSILVGFDNGSALTKYSYCGDIEWRIEGMFHHSIEFFGEDALWAWGNPGEPDPSKWKPEKMVKLEVETGKVIREFLLSDVHEANPQIDIFGMRQKDSEKGSQWVYEGGQHWHANDVDPLPAELSRYYPGFKAEDLLLSLRSINLILVIDPETLHVKWWRQGLTRRQHDPDWNDRGTITIYDNNMHRKFSRIVEVDPKTFKSRTLVDGRNYDFYSWIRGKHQPLVNGGFLITSPQQGRAFELDEAGNITFEFLNTYEKGRGNLVLSEAMFLPPDYFKELPRCD